MVCLGILAHPLFSKLPLLLPSRQLSQLLFKQFWEFRLLSQPPLGQPQFYQLVFLFRPLWAPPPFSLLASKFPLSLPLSDRHVGKPPRFSTQCTSLVWEPRSNG